jgi:ubiquinone/menaquinone biosynthesis C-methylase UbiE
MTDRWYKVLYDHFPDYDEEPYVQNTDAEVDFIERELKDAEAWILDVGCGTGRHALELARRGFDIVGLDLSESMVAQGRDRAREEELDVSFVVADARALPFAEAFRAALILCEGGFSLLESDAGDRAIIENVARVLKPGGRLLMTAPHAAFIIVHPSEEGAFDLATLRETFQIEAVDEAGGTMELEGSQRYYTCPELKALLRAAGFDAVRCFAVRGDGFTWETPLSRDHFEIGVTAKR